jgi:hypothetical protein
VVIGRSVKITAALDEEALVPYGRAMAASDFEASTWLQHGFNMASAV